MKRGIGISGCFLALFLVLGLTAYGVSTPASEASAADVSCRYCGMMKSKFGHTWMIIEYNDGSKSEVCSIHCASMDMALNIDKQPKAIMVGDYNTKKMIDAEKAFWVIGGSKPGVMTARAKWAFQQKQDADKFIKESGGKAANFEDAVKAAFEDMYSDTKMIRKKREMKRTKKGS